MNHESQSRPQRPHLPEKRRTENALTAVRVVHRAIRHIDGGMVPTVKLVLICDIRNAARGTRPLGGVVQLRWKCRLSHPLLLRFVSYPLFPAGVRHVEVNLL